MPKTTFQRVIFTIIGVLLMATTMATYNKYLACAEGTAFYEAWSLEFFKQVGIAFLEKAPLAFILQFFFVQKWASKICMKYPTDNEIVKRCIRVGVTALIMAPIMCVYSNLIIFFESQGTNYAWSFWKLITNILVKLPVNWIFAFFIQVLVLKPLNSIIFKAIFYKKINEQPGN